MDPTWIALIASLVGALIGAYVGVRVAVGKLETRMATVEAEIVLLRQAKHDHAGFLTQHELRITNLERVER